MGSKRNHFILNLAQVLVWACVMVLPAIVNWMVSGDSHHAAPVLRGSVMMMLPLLVVYAANYILLVPRLLFRKKTAWFIAANALIILLLNFRILVPQEQIPEQVMNALKLRDIWAFRLVAFLSSAFFQTLFVFLAIGVRSILRSNDMQLQLQEERRKTTEAELTWLKNQLNPHFLFNTLNNISSLTQIDPDKAQESIGQLSDTLRYALYDTNADKVPLSGEVEFMDNYIHLMQLRCNERTEVTTAWELPPADVRIAPLLFISLIENAFKHGVNARMDSFVHISLHPEGKDLVFRCENSLFEKTGEDHIGSGIGVENLKRRLELIYPENYSYEQTAADGVYAVRLVLKNLIG
ncbi:MAG: histidine kinase [Bacteroidales bacterium]|nr:histidine kinase [Bacteroidales bacterium]